MNPEEIEKVATELFDIYWRRESIGRPERQKDVARHVLEREQKLREALGKYGRHLDCCSLYYIKEQYSCSCGLEEALKQ